MSFHLVFVSQLNEIKDSKPTMAGGGPEEERVVVSPRRICPGVLEPKLAKRAEHYFSENMRAPAATTTRWPVRQVGKPKFCAINLKCQSSSSSTMGSADIRIQDKLNIVDDLPT
ncbi:hypothetical protein D5086_032453 [Populus alba]|uniref:Uncharacterized protein n=1 Tax=Populus alba TaxID=43335 RepID=A0ACC4ALD5_POPAL